MEVGIVLCAHVIVVFPVAILELAKRKERIADDGECANPGVESGEPLAHHTMHGVVCCDEESCVQEGLNQDPYGGQNEQIRPWDHREVEHETAKPKPNDNQRTTQPQPRVTWSQIKGWC